MFLLKFMLSFFFCFFCLGWWLSRYSLCLNLNWIMHLTRGLKTTSFYCNYAKFTQGKRIVWMFINSLLWFCNCQKIHVLFHSYISLIKMCKLEPSWALNIVTICIFIFHDLCIFSASFTYLLLIFHHCISIQYYLNILSLHNHSWFKSLDK